MLDSTPFNHPDTGDAATTLKSAAARSACVGSGRPLEEDLDARSVDVLSKPSFLHRGQLIIVNEGSTTRDYLAFERNYLSWMKLVATCMVISGALIIRLQINADTNRLETSLESRFAIPVGIVFFVISALSLLAATSSFFRTQREMLAGLGHVASGPLIEFTSILITLTLAAACVLFMVSTSQSSTL